MTLSPNVWFPALTAFLGLLVGAFVQVSTRWIDRKEVAEDREARRAETRADYQHQTLLELQDGLADMVTAVGSILDERQSYSAMARRLFEAKARVYRLQVRVPDDTLRKLVQVCIDGAEPPGTSPEEIKVSASRQGDAFRAANARVGELLLAI